MPAAIPYIHDVNTSVTEPNARITALIAAALESYNLGDVTSARARTLGAFPLLVEHLADRDLASACFALSRALADGGVPDKAFKVLDVGLEFYLTGENRSLHEFPQFLNRFGDLLRQEHRYTEAEPLFLEALKPGPSGLSPSSR